MEGRFFCPLELAHLGRFESQFLVKQESIPPAIFPVQGVDTCLGGTNLFCSDLWGFQLYRAMEAVSRDWAGFLVKGANYPGGVGCLGLIFLFEVRVQPRLPKKDRLWAVDKRGFLIAIR